MCTFGTSFIILLTVAKLATQSATVNILQQWKEPAKVKVWHQWKQPAKVKVWHMRNEEAFLRVEIQGIHEEVRQLRLKPVDDIWCKNSAIITLEEHGEGIRKAEFMDRYTAGNFRVYHDQKSGAVLGIDGQSVNGILDRSHSIKTFGDRHYIYKLKEDKNYHQDYLVPQTLENYFNGSFKELIGLKQSEPIKNYTAEILVVVDSLLASKIGSTDSEVIKYLSIFWHAVNARFATINNPKFEIKLVAAIILRTSAGETFITQHLVPVNKVNVTAFGSFGSWIEENYNSNALPMYDLAYLQTGRDMVDYKGNSGLAGLAFIATACPAESYGPYYAIAMAEDINAFYDGVQAAAHEVGHGLGSLHDGSDTLGVCPWTDGYIMSYVAGSVNKLYFSNCSISAMANYAMTSHGACLSSNNNTDSLLPSSLLPGDFVSMDLACQKKTAKSTATAYSKSNCFLLRCKVPVSGSYYIYTFPIPPPEGSQCIKSSRLKGRCINGKCV